MIKIALFGGSFDPVHTDHVNIAKACHEKLGFAEVWFLPAYLNPFKVNQHSSVKDRLAMLQIVVDQYDWMRINEYEINNQEPTYTYESVKFLQKNYPQYEFSFIMGSDQLDGFEQWYDFHKLIKMIAFKVFLRDPKHYNHQIVKKYHLETFSFDNHHLSSTAIRHLKHLNLQIPEINDYCNLHLLYLSERLEPTMSKERYQHSLNVGKTAQKLATLNGVDDQKALVAGTLHDATKEWSVKKNHDYLQQYLPFLLTEPEPVWHSFTGYLYLKNVWLINDQEILQAVFNHTVGAPDMNLMDIVVFCADKISPERNYLGVEKYRELCYKDLTAGFKVLLKRQYERAVERAGKNGVGLRLTNAYQFWINNVRE